MCPVLVLLGLRGLLLLWGRVLVRILGLVRVLLWMGGGGEVSPLLFVLGVAVFFVFFVSPVG